MLGALKDITMVLVLSVCSRSDNSGRKVVLASLLSTALLKARAVRTAVRKSTMEIARVEND
jgi:hypothetical protein